jgi:hypothetical protein
LAGTFLANKKLLAGTVPANKELLAGRVPANNLFLKVIAYELFLQSSDHQRSQGVSTT